MTDNQTSVLNHSGGTYKTGGFFTTFTGKRVNPLDPDPSQLVIEDMAHALSNIGRFGGHAKSFYSVAQHSCHVADLVWIYTGNTMKALKGLLHDTTEAYVGDLVRPLKNTEAMEQFRNIERVFDRRICSKFSLPDEEFDTLMIPEVIAVDNYVVCVEAINLFTPQPKWALYTLEKSFDFKFVWESTWQPFYAKAQFMKRFLKYSGVDLNENLSPNEIVQIDDENELVKL